MNWLRPGWLLKGPLAGRTGTSPRVTGRRGGVSARRSQLPARSCWGLNHTGHMCVCTTRPPGCDKFTERQSGKQCLSAQRAWQAGPHRSPAPNSVREPRDASLASCAPSLGRRGSGTSLSRGAPPPFVTFLSQRENLPGGSIRPLPPAGHKGPRGHAELRGFCTEDARGTRSRVGSARSHPGPPGAVAGKLVPAPRPHSSPRPRPVTQSPSEKTHWDSILSGDLAAARPAGGT